MNYSISSGSIATTCDVAGRAEGAMHATPSYELLYDAVTGTGEYKVCAAKLEAIDEHSQFAFPGAYLTPMVARE